MFIGKGDGTFSTNLQYHFASCIYADFERINKLSTACAGGVNTLTFFHINPDGSFNLANPLGSVSFAGSFQFTGVLQALDWNGDGILDIVLNSNDGLQVAIGNPGLTFSTPVPYAAGTTTATNYVTGAFSDLDGDGHPDFVSTGPHSVYISYGSASGSFSAPVLNTAGTNLYTSTTAEFLNGFADNLTLSCENLPAYASCTFVNGTMPLAANQSIDSQMVIDTDSVLGYQSHRDGLLRQSYGPVLALLMPGCVLLLVRPRIRPGILALIVACVLLTSAGCGGSGTNSGSGSNGVSGTGGSTGNPPPVVPPHTAPGTYTSM